MPSSVKLRRSPVVVFVLLVASPSRSLGVSRCWINCHLGFDVSLETSGALSIAEVNQAVSRVVDIKTPDSGEVHRNDWSNVDHLTPNDQIKFVLCSRQDYDWARMRIDENRLTERVSDVLFSPSFEQLDAAVLADWMLLDRVPARLQIQLHKLLWQDAPGH